MVDIGNQAQVQIPLSFLRSFLLPSVVQFVSLHMQSQKRMMRSARNRVSGVHVRICGQSMFIGYCDV